MTRIGIFGGLAALLSSTSAFAQTGEWRVSEASGRVVMRDAAGDHPVARGGLVPAGATLLTGPGARAVVVRGEDFVTVAANSRLRVPAAAQATGLFQMVQEWGQAVFRIKHLPKPHFAVQTPYLAAVVKGTTFSVTVTGEGASLQVTDGAVEVATTDGGAHELVRPGAVATVTAVDRFRLTMQGQVSRVIDSPARGTGEPAPQPAAEPAPALTAAGEDDTIAWSEVETAVVTAPITAKPVDIGTLTGGMVTGRTGVEVAALVSPAVARSAAEAPSGPITAAAAVAAAPAPAPISTASVTPTPATPVPAPDVKATATAAAADPMDMSTGKVTKEPAEPESPAAAPPAAAAADTPSVKTADAGLNVAGEPAKTNGTAADPVKPAEAAAGKAVEDAKPVAEAAAKPATDASAADDKGKADKDAEKVGKDAEKAAKDADKAADDAAKKVADDAKKAADAQAKSDAEVRKAADDAAKKAAEDAKKLADDAAKIAEDVKKADDKARADKDAEKAAKDAAKAADDVAKSAAKAAEDAAKDAAKSAKDDGKSDNSGKGSDSSGSGKSGKGKKGLLDIVTDVIKAVPLSR